MTGARAQLNKAVEAPAVARPGARAAASLHPVLELQRTVGNRATADLVAKWNARPCARGAAALHPVLELQRERLGTTGLVETFTNLGVQKTPTPTNTPPPAPGKFDSQDEPRLQAAAKVQADRVIASVRPIETKITTELEEIAKANAGKLEGLAHRLKTVESLQRKLADLARTRVNDKRETIEDAVAAEAANTKDALRYTITVPPVGYAALADTKLRVALEAKGAKRIKAANAWADPDGSYKGFNSAYEINSSGEVVKFEVQIHTPASWAMKSELHEQYEDARKETNMSKAAKVWLNNVMKARWKGVEVPAGIEQFDKNMNKR